MVKAENTEPMLQMSKFSENDPSSADQIKMKSMPLGRLVGADPVTKRLGGGNLHKPRKSLNVGTSKYSLEEELQRNRRKTYRERKLPTEFVRERNITFQPPKKHLVYGNNSGVIANPEVIGEDPRNLNDSALSTNNSGKFGLGVDFQKDEL